MKMRSLLAPIVTSLLLCALWRGAHCECKEPCKCTQDGFQFDFADAAKMFS